MRHQNTVFHALIKAIPRPWFDRQAERSGGDRRVRRLPCWSQMVALIYAQLAGIGSLRELEAALASHGNLAYHLGLGPVRRATLADANAKRPYEPFQAVIGRLLARLQPGHAATAQAALRLIDASPLKLSALAGWARFTDASTAAKLHVVYDPNAAVPTYFAITPARINDITVAKQMPIEAGATYVFDKGYGACPRAGPRPDPGDFGFWAALDAAGCRFVTRLKINTPLEVVEIRPCPAPPILADRVVRLPGRLAQSRVNPMGRPVRAVTVGLEDGRSLALVTNDLWTDAAEIAALYRARWQVELFFRWVKQNLEIKRFLGISENAVRLQIACALIAYLLLRLAQDALPKPASLQHLARLARANLLHKKPVAHLLHPPPRPPGAAPTPQLALDLTHAHA